MKHLSLIVALLLAAHAHAATYTFTRIVDTSGPFVFWGGLSMNDAGVVAFVSNPPQPQFRSVVRADENSVVIIADGNDFNPPAGIYDDTSINSAGDVAFSTLRLVTPTPPTNVWEYQLVVGNEAGVTVVAANSAGFHYQINDAGQIGMSGLLAGFGYAAARWEAGAFTVFDTFANFPSINESGYVVYRVGGTPEWQAISGNGKVLVSTDDGFVLLDPLAVNDSGVVCFVGYGGDLVPHLYTYSDGVISPQLSTTTLTWSYVDMNNAGTIVFLGRLNSVDGLYDGPDPLTNKIIAEGDALDGSTLTYLEFQHGGLNNSGQVAFYAQLADGRKGIYRANPVIPCSADTDGSGAVNVTDLLNVITYWGQSPPALSGADVNHDGTVNVDDLLAVVSAWGPC